MIRPPAVSAYSWFNHFFVRRVNLLPIVQDGLFTANWAVRLKAGQSLMQMISAYAEGSPEG